jgi:hypothetical protein
MLQMERDFNDKMNLQERQRQVERQREQEDLDRKLNDLDVAHRKELAGIEAQKVKRLATLGAQRTEENKEYGARLTDLDTFLADSLGKFDTFKEQIEKAGKEAGKLHTDAEKKELQDFLKWVEEYYLPTKASLLSGETAVSPEAWARIAAYNPPGRQLGGPVTEDQVVEVHRGEYIVPRGGVLVREAPISRGGGGDRVVNLAIPITLDGREIARVVKGDILAALNPDSYAS